MIKGHGKVRRHGYHSKVLNRATPIEAEMSARLYCGLVMEAPFPIDGAVRGGDHTKGLISYFWHFSRLGKR
jgi:hypothetical protein